MRTSGSSPRTARIASRRPTPLLHLPEEPSGVLRLTTLEAFGHAQVLARLLMDFCRLHPKVNLLVERGIAAVNGAAKRRAIAMRAGSLTTSFGQVLGATIGGDAVGLLPSFSATKEIASGRLLPS